MSKAELFFTVVAWIIFVPSVLSAILASIQIAIEGGDVSEENSPMGLIVFMLLCCGIAFLPGLWLYIVYFT